MFSDKARNTLRIVVGLYVVYLGGTLVIDVYQAKPNNMVLLIMIGIAFVIIGGLVAGFAVKGYVKSTKTEREELAGEDSENEEDIAPRTAGIAPALQPSDLPQKKEKPAEEHNSAIVTVSVSDEDESAEKEVKEKAAVEQKKEQK